MFERFIIGLVGPSGVGKGYAKEALKRNLPKIREPVVVTTRPQRKTDGPDRKAGVAIETFQKQTQAGEIKFAHQPFGPDGDWYGFDQQSLTHKDGELILTEVHPENVEPFREEFPEGLLLIALVASQDYLESNLRSRGSEDEESLKLRLVTARRETDQIVYLQSKGQVDLVVEVNQNNRGGLDDLITIVTLTLLQM